MNIAFYISGRSSRLFKFLTQTSADVSVIKVVISDYNIEEALLGLLHKNDIRNCVFEYRNLPGDSRSEKNEELSNRILSVLDALQIDYCFSFGSHLLKGELLKQYKYRLINFHPAILPMYPGKKSIDQAVEHGNTFLVGNTAHFIDEGIDTGTIIMQSVIPLQSFFDSGRNYDVILDIQIEMLNRLIEIIKSNALTVLDGRVKIAGADYRISHIYPAWESKADSILGTVGTEGIRGQILGKE